MLKKIKNLSLSDKKIILRSKKKTIVFNTSKFAVKLNCSFPKGVLKENLYIINKNYESE